MSITDNYQAEGADVSSAQKIALDALTVPDNEHITIHMVHLNHLDLTWYWRIPDTIEMCLETIRWHVDLLEQHPDARYSHTQVFTLKLVEQIDYPLFERFVKLVKEGRVEIDSGQVVEPDHNIPSGESMVRQFLYGQRYLQSRFGVRATTLVNSDSFGHTRSLPQIFKQAGIRHMIFKRPRQRYVDLPETPFYWTGIDGTQIAALRFINKGAGLPSLSQYYDLPEGMTDLQEKVNRNLAAGIHDLFGSHCMADSGGAAPYVQPLSGDQYTLKYDTPTAFFESVLSEKNDLPVLDKLFNYVFEGCYTSHIHEKENCRRAEKELREVELLWTHAALLGFAYPDKEIHENWERLCYLQFHDILPGTGSPEAHMDSRAHYHELFINNNILRRKAHLLLDSCCSNNEGIRSILVANPRPALSSGIAGADISIPIYPEQISSESLPETGLIIDDEGNQLPYQFIDRRTYQRYRRGTMIFPVVNVPPMSLKTFRIVEGEAGPSAVSAADGVLENEFLRVEVGGRGIIKSIKTKKDNQERLKSVDAPVRIELWPETDYLGDYGSPMKAWMLGVTDKKEYAVPVADPVVIENGPVRATIRTEFEWGSSRFIADVSLYAGQDYVDISVEMDWHEKEVLTRLCVEPELSGTIRRTYGIPFGYENATGDELEVPAIGWVDMSGDDGSMSLLNRDRPGHTFRDNSMRVSLVRCATGNHDPCTDSGIIKAALRIVPHDSSIEDAIVPQKSDEFSYPFTAWQVENKDGCDKSETDLFKVDGEGILLSSLKVAENLDGYVIRLYESLGRSVQATVTFNQAIGNGSYVSANILEDEGEKLDSVDGKLTLTFTPFEIKTLLVKTKESIPELNSEFTGSFFTK